MLRTKMILLEDKILTMCFIVTIHIEQACNCFEGTQMPQQKKKPAAIVNKMVAAL